MFRHCRLALDATILSAPSLFEWTVYGAQWLPFPMTHADLVIHARWTDLADVRPLYHLARCGACPSLSIRVLGWSGSVPPHVALSTLAVQQLHF